MPASKHTRRRCVYKSSSYPSKIDLDDFPGVCISILIIYLIVWIVMSESDDTLLLPTAACSSGPVVRFGPLKFWLPT